MTTNLENLISDCRIDTLKGGDIPYWRAILLIDAICGLMKEKKEWEQNDLLSSKCITDLNRECAALHEENEKLQERVAQDLDLAERNMLMDQSLIERLVGDYWAAGIEEDWAELDHETSLVTRTLA